MRILGKSAVVVAAAASAVVVATGTASASSGTYAVDGSGVARGYGEFQSSGEIFRVCDIATDGFGARLYWSVPSTGATGHINDYSGNDGQCATKNLSIAEKAQVRYRVCLTENGSAFACTDPATIDHA